MLFGNMPIRRKLMTALLLTSGTVLVLTCAAFVTYEFITLRKNMLTGLTTRAEIIAANLTASLAFRNEADALEVISALKRDRRVQVACVYDAQGRIFARYPADAPAGDFPAASGASGYRGGYLEIFCPVAQGERALGTVYLRSDLSALTERYRAYAWMVVAVIAVSLLVAFLLSRLLQEQISRPVLALAGTARAISNDRDFSVRARKFGEDELGLLTDAFNRMLAEILAREQALKASEVNYREIFDKANDAIYIHDPETGRVLDVNQRTCELFGFTREEFINGDPNQFMTGNPGFTLEDATRWLKKAATEGPQLFEWQGLNKKKELKWLEVSIKQAVIAGQKRLLALVRDIGDRKLAQEALAEKTRLLDSVMGTMSEGIVVADRSGKMIYFNKGAERIIGIGMSTKASSEWTKEYGVFKEDKDATFPEDELPLVKAVRGVPSVGVVQFLKNSGHPNGIFISVNGTPLRNAKGELDGGLVVVRDITANKKAEEKLLNYTKRLEESNRDLQDFVFVASHDLQEPLRKIQSFGNFLKEEAGSLSTTAADYLGRMQDAARRMGLLIEDMLQLTRITTRAQPFVSLDLSEIVKEVVSDLEMRMQETEGKVEWSGLPSLEADASQMRQLFQNLIGNALKFHREGVAPRVEVTGRVDKVQQNCVLQVKDNGIGFDPKYSDKIFNIFQRLNGQEYEGTGIGLAICRKVVERHNGTIKAESKPGEGSVFEITLPLHQIPKGEKT